MRSLARLLELNGTIKGKSALGMIQRSTNPLLFTTRPQTQLRFLSGSNRRKEFGRNKRRKNNHNTNQSTKPDTAQKLSNRTHLLMGSWMAMALWGCAMWAFPPEDLKQKEHYTQDLRTFGGKTMKRKGKEESQNDNGSSSDDDTGENNALEQQAQS